MAHFAKLGVNGKIIGVHVVNDRDCLNVEGEEDEEVGQRFLEKLHGWEKSMWKQTSYNTRNGKHYKPNTATLSDDQSKALRGTYAGIGMIYDEENDIFIKEQPYASWIKNVSTATWDPPTPMPDDAEGQEWYQWNESLKSWEKQLS